MSTDPEFSAKAADIVGLYLNPPETALVISVDEKPSIQALERATGYVETDQGNIVRGFKRTYKRHGTLNLFAALEVATGTIHTQITRHKRRLEFLDFMDHLMTDMPEGKDIHVILDNYCIHKRNDPWLAAHPNVVFHFTPTSASWLNQVENLVWDPCAKGSQGSPLSKHRGIASGHRSVCGRLWTHSQTVCLAQERSQRLSTQKHYRELTQLSTSIPLIRAP